MSYFTALAMSALSLCVPHAFGQSVDTWWIQSNGTLTTNGVETRVYNTVSLRLFGPTFCGIETVSMFNENAWIIRGTSSNRRLVVASREVVRGSLLDNPIDKKTLDLIASSGPKLLEPTTYFVQPTALVVSDKHSGAPRGDFSVFSPLLSPSSAAQAELNRHCELQGARAALSSRRAATRGLTIQSTGLPPAAGYLKR